MISKRLKRSRRRFLALLGAGGLAGTPITRLALGQSTDQPRIEPVFSYPTSSGLPDHRHEDVVKQLLREAVPGTSVYFTIFTFTRDTMAEAFETADKRGVDLNLLIDERGRQSSATSRVLAELPDSTSVVYGGGVGDRHNHNKFLLLEELYNGDEHVVWQSSSNFTDPQRHNHNTSVVIANDKPLYEAYRSYWEDLADEEFQDLSYNRTEHGETATVYFSPRDDIDTHVQALADIVPSEDATIHFMFSIWTTSREAESGLIEEQLARLVEGGCDVKVVMQQRDEISEALTAAGVDVVEYPDVESDVHSKNMLIDADFETDDGIERRREVWTGSQNLSRPGLRRNDETVLRIVDEYVYQQFRHDWERVYRQAKRASGDEGATTDSGMAGADEGGDRSDAGNTAATGQPAAAGLQAAIADGGIVGGLIFLLRRLVG